MARINAYAVIRKLIDGLGLSPFRDKTPVEVADKVLPVFNVNPDPEIQHVAKILSDATSTTVLTTHATKKTFLTSISLSYTKSALATSVFSSVTIVPVGKGVVRILNLRFEPTTAGNGNADIAFSKPIELEKGTTILLTHSTAIASIDSEVMIGFYEEDVI